MRLSKIVLLKSAAATLIVAAVITSSFVYDFYSFKNKPINLAQQRLFVVEPGASLARVAQVLQTEGLIDRPRYLTWLGRLNGHENSIKAGEYLLDPGIKPQQLLDKMVAGEVLQYAITVVEGWNFAQLLQTLHQHDKINPTLKDVSGEQIMAQLDLPGESPEGRFLPETYHFTAGMTDLLFLRRAFEAMNKLLEKEWQERQPNLPYDSAYEALIMASIIEKETGVPAERPEIAGVFVRRLQQKMRLQTDPTVIYGMGDKFDGNIRRRDLTEDTPYNTYTRDGLPPTPIALPSAAAIRAALHPAEGNTLFFVSKGDGSHYFSATLAEHVEAVRKYQLKQQ